MTLTDPQTTAVAKTVKKGLSGAGVGPFGAPVVPLDAATNCSTVEHNSDYFFLHMNNERRSAVNMC